MNILFVTHHTLSLKFYYRHLLPKINYSILGESFGLEVDRYNLNVKVFLKNIKLIRSSNFDVIHCVGPIALIYASAISLFTGKKVIYTVTGQYWSNYRGFHRFKHQSLYFFLLKTVGTVLCDSKRQVLLLSKKGIYSKLILNGSICGVDTNSFSGIRHDAAYDFGFLGRVCDDKGWDVYSKAIKSYPEKKWLIAGPIEDSKYHELLTTSSNVTYIGIIDDTSTFFEQIKTLVLLSKREGFGGVVIEANAHGIPVLASTIPDLDEACGLFNLRMDAFDVSKVDEFLRCFDARKLQESVMKYSSDKYIKFYIDVYNSIAKNR